MPNDRINRGKRLERYDISEKKKLRKLEYSKWHIQDVRTSHKGLVLRKRSRREKSIREYL